ncbi:MMPL family transporter [Galbibacter sp. BG1]|uniref:efflux RND transporter permease subunit n=1 Tax=Galbibacter sp. BG1 TaxID=1170699 RepID=UPI0015BCDC7E|nr:MMPL family transporter [Galbibacter sp. BG1]QLE02863.1 MMPL family transporter [Galbibacter sp. BG1]
MERLFQYKKAIVIVFLLVAILATFSISKLKFSLDVDSFFPEGDKELSVYKDFVKEFGTDDRFLLIAIENRPNIFEKEFLEKFQAFSKAAKTLPFINKSESLTTMGYPLKTSLGFISLPIIHVEDTAEYKNDWKRIQEENLFVDAFIDKDAGSLVVVLETEANLDYQQSVALLGDLEEMLLKHDLKTFHILGRPVIYSALVDLQRSELIFTTIASSIIVSLLLFFIYRRLSMVIIAFGTITIALLLFLWMIVLLGIELNALSAFYPILILIVGVSDFIHLSDKYVLGLKNGLPKYLAMKNGLKNTGMALLLTSLTTALGFLSLYTSTLVGIREFGLLAALSVIITLVTVLLLGGSSLLILPKKYLFKRKIKSIQLQTFLKFIEKIGKKKGRAVIVGCIVVMAICLLGILQINTNYKFERSLPKGSKISADFSFFQKNYAGLRPFEIEVEAKGNNKITDYKILTEIEKLQQRLSKEKSIKNVQSVTVLYKFLNRAHHLNKYEYYKLPHSSEDFREISNDLKYVGRKQFNRYVNKDSSKARISARVFDIGTDSLLMVYNDLNEYINKNLDKSLADFKLTGKGYLMDANANSVRNNIFIGLLVAISMVSLLMAIIFRNLKLLLITVIVNVLPLLICGAVLGFLEIPLEASISIVFALVFGISVDDTIHFLGSYKIGLKNGLDKEKALEHTFKETGRALTITTIILFSGFAIMIFSKSEPNMIIGLLAALTLLSALLFDLLLLPVLIRKFL